MDNLKLLQTLKTKIEAILGTFILNHLSWTGGRATSTWLAALSGVLALAAAALTGLVALCLPVFSAVAPLRLQAFKPSNRQVLKSLTLQIHQIQ